MITKIAIAGCGDLTVRTVLPHLSRPDAQAQMTVVAVCDTVTTRARDTAMHFEIPTWFDDYDTMLAETDAEAVLIIVPSSLHFACTLKAIESGRHVYVQKPLTTSVAEADTLLVAAARQKIKLVAAPGQVLWPLFRRLRELIAEGAIGTPYHATAPFMGWEGQHIHHDTDPTWHFSSGAGPLRDHGVYGLQTVTTLLGPVSRVAAFARIGTDSRIWRGQTVPVTEPDSAALLLQFACGASGSLYEAWSAGEDATATFRIHGLEGVLQGVPECIGYRGIFPVGCHLYRPGREPEYISVDRDSIPFLQHDHADLYNPHVYADICHLVECIQTGKEPKANGYQARHTVDIIETALVAAQTGTVRSLTDTPCLW